MVTFCMLPTNIPPAVYQPEVSDEVTELLAVLSKTFKFLNVKVSSAEPTTLSAAQY